MVTLSAGFLAAAGLMVVPCESIAAFRVRIVAEVVVMVLAVGRRCAYRRASCR